MYQRGLLMARQLWAILISGISLRRNYFDASEGK
jgi:hypothetical protein